MDKETSEIAKLTERISKDPKSRLFVPLAEEYKKAGDLEMAIHVLSEGLRNNPGYATARYFLGRLLLEKGDTAAAQKEFEEVVEAIPDNLPAHKKLAELLALQGNETDALKHYRIALALNPGDKETAALISELEAVQGAKQDLERRKTGPSPEPAQAPEQPVSQQTAGALNAAELSEPEPLVQPAEREDQAIAGAPASFAGIFEEQSEAAEPAGAGPASASASLFMEQEEPEEVLVVEPLEEEPTSMETLFSGIDFLSQQDEAGASTSAVEDQAQSWPAVGGPQGITEGSSTEEGSFPSVLSEDLSEENAGGLLGEITEALPEPEAAFGQAGEPSDDFTTDTLAELYIAQGFYEKAIDIYQRMLADRPDSRGLKDKLERVRAMAVSSEVPPAAEPAEYLQTKREEGFVDFGPGLPDQAGPAGERPSYPDFEPREYVPPGAGLFQDEAYQPTPEPRTHGQDTGQSIARLEKWLANIARDR